MKIVVVGAGSVGFQLAKQLISEKKDVVLIEKDAGIAAGVSNAIDCMVITGEGTNADVLRRAGTATADYFVAATNSDEVNMIACGVVSAEFSVKARIARVRNFDYRTTQLAQKRFLGIDLLVNPEVEAARAIVRAMDYGAVSDIMAFERSDTQIRNLAVERGGLLDGVAVRSLGDLLPGTFLIAVLIREHRYLIPSGSTVLSAGDVIYLVASRADLEAIFDRLGKAKRNLRRITIVGGGRIGQLVAEELFAPEPATPFQRFARRITGHDQRRVKIVDRNYERCKELTDRFPKALVINADISADGVVEEQHFVSSDLVIASTANQELNIVTALYAKSVGVSRAIALVNRAAYVPIASQLGIDVPVGQKNAIVTSILRFIRSGTVRSVHAISDGRIEAIEFTVALDSPAAGRAISELDLPRDALIVALERDGASLVPSGASVVRGGDNLVVMAKKEHADRVQDIFSS